MVDKSENDKSRDKDPLRDFSDIIEQMMDKLGIDIEDLSSEPFVYGFSVTNLSGEEPEVREFGNYPDEFDLSDGDFFDDQIQLNEFRPLVDLVEIDENIHITAELTGMDKENISLSVTESFVELDAFSGINQYSETIVLPAIVDTESVKASYKNGVLEVVLVKVAEHLRSNVIIE